MDKTDKKVLEKIYQPAEVEPKWLALWEKEAVFHLTVPPSTGVSGGVSGHEQGPALQKRPTFSMVIPPPNVTGSLHVGHALNSTLQDILARWKRMSGYEVLWIPGTDHAGIATQNVVERQLAKEGIYRYTIGREAFIKKIWAWKETSGGTILKQLKRLGASCDWKRERFTLDAGLSRAVQEVFVRLYQEGLIYRAERLINWCPRCQSALSDIEVEHEELMGEMFYVKYPLNHPENDPAENDQGNGPPEAFLTVATTRPETLLGDAAVAVHPEDPRHLSYIGQSVRLPLTHRIIPIVADSVLVDRALGTGAVKMTPGHDFNDEKAGKRHNLRVISLLDKAGVMRRDALEAADVEEKWIPGLEGKSAQEARKHVVQWLEEAGGLIKREPHRHAVGRCYRCKTVIEPMQSLQWFVKVNDPNNSLAQPAIAAVRQRRVRLIPEAWETNFFGWMNQIEDWCISRQIWWGHQIPVWYCVGGDKDHCTIDCKEPIVSLTPPTQCPRCGSTDLRQDPDVLDTWFSSALWPFSTLGWPPECHPLPEARREAEAMLSAFYPTSALVTSFDILFFWVARMMMMGLHFMKEVPFKDVYLQALVRDAEGEKMSKSKGNVIDPLEIMNQYGTDAIRFTLASMASPGRDIKLHEERIEGYRNFTNKLWNAARFILITLPEDVGHAPQKMGTGEMPKHTSNRWIVSRLHRTIGAVDQALKNYRFDEAAQSLYQFIWHEFCDWYLEFVKVDLQLKNLLSDERKAETFCTLSTTFETILKLLHPFMPFITDELASHLRPSDASLTTTPYPAADEKFIDREAEERAQHIIETLTALRNLRGEMNIPSSEILTAFIKPHNEKGEEIFRRYLSYINRMGRVECRAIQIDLSPPKAAAATRTPIGTLYIKLQKTHLTQEIVRLQKALQKVEGELLEVEVKCQDQNFTSKAPQPVVAKLMANKGRLKTEQSALHNHLERIQEIASVSDEATDAEFQIPPWGAKKNRPGG